MKYCSIILLFLLSGSLLRGQTDELVFQGTWLGKLTQLRSAPFDQYRFRMHIAQQGNLVSGYTHISMEDSMAIFAEIEFRGLVADDVLTFQETRIRKGNNYARSSWCIKKATLRLKDFGGLYRLEGDWEGTIGTQSCSPGRIILEKLNPNPPTDLPEPEEEIVTYGSLDGRNIDHQKDVEVNRKTLTVYVWDADKVDGDVVSLSFNGKWLLRNFPIKREKRAIELVLEDNADNRLILYAENEGRLPPNTAALTFFDGEKQRNLSLVSTKSTCGAIRFLLKE
jgi:hypothetical protein